MRRIFVCVSLACLFGACNSQFNAPFSSSPLPNVFSVGDRNGNVSAHTGSATRPAGEPQPLHISQNTGPRNIGTQVWLVPPPAGDLMKLAQHPELWPNAQKRVDVVSLYFLHAYYHDGFVCDKPCGPNTYQNMLDAVPGGMFKWLSERFILAFEGTSVKPYSCTTETMANQIAATNRSIDNIANNGGRLSYISIDEAFMSGEMTDVFGMQGCGLSAADVAALQRVFNDGVHAVHPEVQIGFTEPYPAFTPDQIMSAMLELENVGVPVPYFHLDFDLTDAVRRNSQWPSDIRRIREFFAARAVPFGILMWGSDGTGDGPFMTGALARMRTAYQAVGVTEHTVTQSWAEDPPGDINSIKHAPNTVPETEPGTQTWMVLQILRFMGIQPAR